MSVGTVEAIAKFVGEALAPVKDRLAADQIDDLLAELGVRLPEGLTSQGGIPNALNAAATAAGDLETALPALSAAIEAADADDPASIARAAAGRRDGAAEHRGADQRDLGAVDRRSSESRPVCPAADRQAVEDFATVLPGRLLEFLVLAHIDRRAPQVAPMLNLVGLVEDRAEEGGAASVSRPHQVRRIRLRRFAQALTDPAGYLREVYHWGEPDFTGIELFRPIAELMGRNDFAVTLIEAPGQLPILEAFLGAPGCRSFDQSAGDAIPASPAGDGGFQSDLPAGRAMVGRASTRRRASIPASRARSAPTASSTSYRRPATGTANVKVTAALQAAKTDAAPLDLLGISGATRLQADRITATAGIDARWAPPAAVAEPVVTFEVEKLTAVMDMAGGDSFLREISGGGSGRADVSVSATWSPTSGVRFTGSSALEIAIPAHATIGPATLETVYLRAGFDGAAVPVEISAALRGELGPLTASVDRIGVDAALHVPGQWRQPRAAAGRCRLQAAERRRSLDRRRRLCRRRLPVPRSRSRRVRRRARAQVPGHHPPQGRRRAQHEAAGRQRRLLAAHHHHRRVRADPARLRLHADRRRRPARRQPHDRCSTCCGSACATAR